jgi:siroheme synthase-like protein
MVAEERQEPIGPDKTGLNRLFPIFLKLEELHILIIGGGKIGLEKISAVLKNSPATQVTLVAKKISAGIRDLASGSTTVMLKEKAFEPSDLDSADLVITATGDRNVSEVVKAEAKKRRLLVNVADTPDLCDFYLGSIVQKGDLKIAISTNGKSPTLAKRVKEVLNDTFPENTQEVLENLAEIRSNLKGDFGKKVKRLNEITSVLVKKGRAQNRHRKILV